MSEKFASANLTAGQLNALVKKCGGEEKVLAILRGKVKIVTDAVAILTKVTTQKVSGSGQFVAKEHFEGKSWIYLWDNFKKHFLGKVEDNVSDGTVVSYKLEKDSLDEPILQELGNKSETTLAHLYELLSQQPQGEDGFLLTNGWANIFYVRDAKGDLWAVLCHWDSGGRCWIVRADSVGDPSRWDAGLQVFSCDS